MAEDDLHRLTTPNHEISGLTRSNSFVQKLGWEKLRLFLVSSLEKCNRLAKVVVDWRWSGGR
ncbi:MAG: hypothetical protein WBF29_03115, partial [Syntrophobacteria bacterium]